MYYKVIVKRIIPDEMTGKEKKTTEQYLVSAESTKEAESKTAEMVMRNTMYDAIISSVSETKIEDVIG